MSTFIASSINQTTSSPGLSIVYIALIIAASLLCIFLTICLIVCVVRGMKHASETDQVEMPTVYEEMQTARELPTGRSSQYGPIDLKPSPQNETINLPPVQSHYANVSETKRQSEYLPMNIDPGHHYSSLNDAEKMIPQHYQEI